MSKTLRGKNRTKKLRRKLKQQRIIRKNKRNNHGASTNETNV